MRFKITCSRDSKSKTYLHKRNAGLFSYVANECSSNHDKIWLSAEKSRSQQSRVTHNFLSRRGRLSLGERSHTDLRSSYFVQCACRHAVRSGCRLRAATYYYLHVLHWAHMRISKAYEVLCTGRAPTINCARDGRLAGIQSAYPNVRYTFAGGLTDGY